MSKIPWLEALLEDTLPDGTRVKAMCWYWAKDINVELISPYPGLRTGLHMMYLIPRRFTDNDLWKTRARQMMANLVARGRWIEEHPNAVRERRKEGKRRIGIARKYITVLKAERKDLKRRLKKGLLDLPLYQRHVKAITVAMSSLELIIADQDEIYWLRDGIVEPIAYPVMAPHPSKRPGVKNICVYLHDSALASTAKNGWRRVFETQIPDEDLVAAGFGPITEGRSTLNPGALSSYLARGVGAKSGAVVDAWREIAREDDSWCATVA